MKILFVHDGPIIQDVDGRYHAYSFENMHERYSVFSHDISLLIRVKKIEEKKSLSLINDSIKIIEVPDFKKISVFLKNLRKAKKIIRESVLQSDFVILKMHSSNAFIAYRYAKKYNKPFLSEFVSCAWDSYWNYSFLGKLLAPIMELQTKIVAKNSPFNYYVTKAFLQTHYPSKGLSLGCSDVVLGSLDDSILDERLKKIKCMNPSKPIILGTAASLDVKYKGQQYVIKALSLLRKQGYNVEYHLAGSHDPNNCFLFEVAKKNGVHNYVKYVGVFDNKGILDFYDSIDIYIQPSKQEGLPRSVVEAMSRGCPVLGSKLAGIPELVDDRYMFKKGNVYDISNKIKNLLQSDLKVVSKTNFEHAKDFQYEVLNKKRLDFYKIVNEKIK